MALLFLLQPLFNIVEILYDDGGIIGKSSESEEVTRSTIWSLNADKNVNIGAEIHLVVTAE